MKQENITKTVEVPKDVQTTIEGRKVTISKGDKTLSRDFKSKLIEFKKEGNKINIIITPGNRKTNALAITISKHLTNMILGVNNDYVYKLAIVYSHFPMTVAVKDRNVEVNNFAGGKKPRIIKILGDQTKVQVKGKEVIVSGPNKEQVGQTAANIELGTRIQGKDRRVFQDGIYLTEKGMNEAKQ